MFDLNSAPVKGSGVIGEKRPNWLPLGYARDRGRKDGKQKTDVWPVGSNMVANHSVLKKTAAKIL
jgi:hypothetical protein